MPEIVGRVEQRLHRWFCLGFVTHEKIGLDVFVCSSLFRGSLLRDVRGNRRQLCDCAGTAVSTMARGSGAVRQGEAAQGRKPVDFFSTTTALPRVVSSTRGSVLQGGIVALHRDRP